MPDDHFLTTDEAVEYLQINHRTLYRLLKREQIPAVRVGRQWRFRLSEIDAWAKACGRTGRQSTDRIRVLVVDDDPQVSKYISEALSKGDYDVEAADSGPAALERLQDADIDLVFTDLKMPGMDGLTMIREARRQALDVPIVIVTGQSTEESAIEAVNLGVVGYLLKPFSPNHVIAAAKRALSTQAPPAW
jgi:excisionase family DNA binding protein